MRYHITFTKMTKIKTANKPKCWRGCKTTGTHTSLKGLLLEISMWKTVWLFLVPSIRYLAYDGTTGIHRGIIIYVYKKV